MWEEDLSETARLILLQSYVRRKRWEADLLATRIVRRLGEALGAAERGREISTAEMLGRLGVRK